MCVPCASPVLGFTLLSYFWKIDLGLVVSLPLLFCVPGWELFSIVTSFWEDVTSSELFSFSVVVPFWEDTVWLG